ncbi:phage virion morphogenesis protein [Serratia ficaria]|uniref:phage virion morphogenesis protein n=1 Tax=Serratia ficaria TaxID=61651 RepID=UPI00218366B6|nr:phage virion morphogenesis protein [Serratia ficaria]CAI2488016.1 phage virion morphogenesis protein [Serratia ficaria]CAI2530508.1 phage virion morphogenesis protein [Serratia ficaria]
MTDTALFHQLDQVFADILGGMSPAGRLRTAREVGRMLRQSQSRRIARQESPDGAKFEKRRRKVLRSQAGIGFIWNGETRRLKNWRATKGSRGRMLTGFDEGRGAVRSFYREDIERYLDINFTQTRKDTTKGDPMFRRLRTARFLKARADASGATVGYTGVAARIARTHQYGLRDRVNTSGAMATYPQRQLLGITKADRMAIARSVIDSLGVK